MKPASLAPLLPSSSCADAHRAELVGALYQAAQIDPEQLENLTKPQQVVRDLASALESSSTGPALAEILACSPYVILLCGRFIEAYGQWLLRPDGFSIMITAVETAAKRPKWKNSLTRFHPYNLPETVGRDLTETIIACAELDELTDKTSWPLPHVIRPSQLEGEADFFYHLILAVVRGDEVLTCRHVLESGATMALWVGGLVVAIGEYHKGDRAALSRWAQNARFETIATLRQLLETGVAGCQH